MAIIINKKISVMGIELKQLYVRLRFTSDFKDSIRISSECYASKEAFASGSGNNVLNIGNIPKFVEAKHDSKKDGDILKFIHDKFIETLLKDQTKNVAEYDEKGNYVSQKKIITEESLFKKSNVEIIDLD